MAIKVVGHIQTHTCDDEASLVCIRALISVAPGILATHLEQVNVNVNVRVSMPFICCATLMSQEPLRSHNTLTSEPST